MEMLLCLTKVVRNGTIFLALVDKVRGQGVSHFVQCVGIFFPLV